MKTILITGGGGYIGSVLTPFLIQNGYRIVVIDRFFFGRQTLPKENKKLKIIKKDIRKLEKEDFAKIDCVIDLAALSNDPSGELDPKITLAINWHGRVRVAKIAKKAGVKKYIFPSSCSVYGFQKGILNEKSKTKPLTTYAKSNLRAEKDILPFASKKFCVVILRQATVYGLSPRMRFDLAINGMVRGLYKNKIIPILRDGSQWRPFLNVNDAARAILMMVKMPSGKINRQIFNVGSDKQNYQIMKLARLVARSVDLPFKYKWYGLPDNRSYRVSFRKIKKLGFKSKYTPFFGAKEIFQALRKKKINPNDPKTITVKWYQYLIQKKKIKI